MALKRRYFLKFIRLYPQTKHRLSEITGIPRVSTKIDGPYFSNSTEACSFLCLFISCELNFPIRYPTIAPANKAVKESSVPPYRP